MPRLAPECDRSHGRPPRYDRFTPHRAFSLVEVMLALGLLSFAFIGLLGLLPVGLTTFKDSVDTSVSAQIMQQVARNVQSTDFANLQSCDYQFDEQGNILANPNDPKRQYHVRVTVQKNTSLPTGGDSSSLATVVVQIAANPGDVHMRTDSATGLWVSTPGVVLRTRPVLVARNQPLP